MDSLAEIYNYIINIQVSKAQAEAALQAFSPEQLKKIETNMNKMVGAVRQELGAVQQTWSRSFSTALQAMVVWGTTASAIYGTLRKIREFGQEILKIEDIQTKMAMTLGSTRAGEFFEEAMKLAKEYGVSLDETTDAAMQWGRATKDDKTAFEGLRRSIELGITTFTDISDMSQRLIVVTNELNLSWEEQQKLVTTLFALYQNFPALDIQALVTNMQKVGGQAEALGITMTQLATIMAYATQVNPSRGATDLERFFSTIVKSKDKIIPFLKQFGIEIQQNGQWLTQLLQQYPTWTAQQQLQFLALFPTRGPGTFTYFLSQGKELVGLLDQMGDASEKFGNAIDTYSADVTAALNRWKLAQQNLASNSIGVFVPALTSITETLSGLLNTLNAMGSIMPLMLGGALAGGGLLVAKIFGGKLWAELMASQPTIAAGITAAWTRAGGAKGVILPLAISFVLRYFVNVSGIEEKFNRAVGPKGEGLIGALLDALNVGILTRIATKGMGIAAPISWALTIGIPVIINLLPQFMKMAGAGQEVLNWTTAGTNIFNRTLIGAMVLRFLGAGRVGALAGPWGVAAALAVSVAIEIVPKIISKIPQGEPDAQAKADIQRMKERWLAYSKEAGYTDMDILAYQTRALGDAAQDAALDTETLLTVLEDLTGQANMLNNVFSLLPKNLRNLGFEAQFLRDNFKQALEGLKPTPTIKGFLEKIMGVTTPYLWPTSGYTKITAPFGVGTDWYNTGAPHRGMDIGAPLGTPVIAPQQAEVIAAGILGSYGNRIMLKFEDGTKMLFAHLYSIVTEVGQKVEAGQTIGYVGMTGLATGPHLHVEAYNPAGELVNPMQYLAPTLASALPTTAETQAFLDFYANAEPETRKVLDGMLALAGGAKNAQDQFDELTKKIALWNIGLENADTQVELASIAVENYDKQLQGLPDSIDTIGQRSELLRAKQEALLKQYLAYSITIPAAKATIAELQSQLAKAMTEQEQMDLESQINQQTIALERLQVSAQEAAGAIGDINKELQLLGYSQQIKYLGMVFDKSVALMGLAQTQGTMNTSDAMQFYRMQLEHIQQSVEKQHELLETLRDTGATSEEIKQAELDYLSLKTKEAEIQREINKLLAQQEISRRLAQPLPGGLAGTWAGVARWISGTIPGYMTQGMKETTSATLEDLKDQISRYVITPFDNLASIIERIGDLAKEWGEIMLQGAQSVYLKFTDITQEIFTMASGYYAKLNAELGKGIPPVGSWAAQRGMKGVWVPELGAIAPGLAPRQQQAWMDWQRTQMDQMEKQVQTLLWGATNVARFEEYRRRGATEQEVQGYQQWILTYSLLAKNAPYILQALPEEYRLPAEQIISPERAMATVTMQRPDLIAQAATEGEIMGNLIAEKIREIEHPIYITIDMPSGVAWRTQINPATEFAATGVGPRIKAL